MYHEKPLKIVKVAVKLKTEERYFLKSFLEKGANIATY